MGPGIRAAAAARAVAVLGLGLVALGAALARGDCLEAPLVRGTCDAYQGICAPIVGNFVFSNESSSTDNLEAEAVAGIKVFQSNRGVVNEACLAASHFFVCASIFFPCDPAASINGEAIPLLPCGSSCAEFWTTCASALAVYLLTLPSPAQSAIPNCQNGSFAGKAKQPSDVFGGRNLGYATSYPGGYVGVDRFPEGNSSYVLSTLQVVETQCYLPAESNESLILNTTCVAPLYDGVNANGIVECRVPCPFPVFDSFEIDQVQLALIITGFVGLVSCGLVFADSVYTIMDQSNLRTFPTRFKSSFTGQSVDEKPREKASRPIQAATLYALYGSLIGIVFFLMGPLPALVQGRYISCGGQNQSFTISELTAGTADLSDINCRAQRFAPFLAQAIFNVVLFSLANMMLVVRPLKIRANTKRILLWGLRLYCFGIPPLFALIAGVLDKMSTDLNTAVSHVIRGVAMCAMRFENQTIEVVLVDLPLILTGLAICVCTLFVLKSIRHILSMSKAIQHQPTTGESKGSKAIYLLVIRLAALGIASSILLLAYIVSLAVYESDAIQFSSLWYQWYACSDTALPCKINECATFQDQLTQVKPSLGTMAVQTASLSTFIALFGLFNVHAVVSRLRTAPQESAKARKDPGQTVLSVAQSSIYVCNTGLGATDHMATHVRIRSLEIGHDTLWTRWMGRDRGLKAAKTLAVGSNLDSVLLLVRIVAELLLLLSFVGVVSNLVSVFAALASLATSLPYILCCLSLSVLQRLIVLPKLLTRIFLLTLYLFTYMSVVNFDARSFAVLVLGMPTLFVLLSDALLGDIKQSYRFPLRALSWTITPFWMWLLLVTSSITGAQENTTITVNVGAASYNWSNLSAAISYGLILGLAISKDAFELWQGLGSKRLIYIMGAIHIRCLALQEERPEKAWSPRPRALERGGSQMRILHGILMPVSSNGPAANKVSAEYEDQAQEENSSAQVLQAMLLRPQARFTDWGALGASKMAVLDGVLVPRQTAVSSSAGSSESATSSTASVDTIVLKESQSVAVRLLGEERGAILLARLGQPRTRVGLSLLKLVPLLFWITLCLPGIIDPLFSIFTLLALGPILAAFAIKSTVVMTLLMQRAAFVFDLIMALVVFGTLGFLFADARIVSFPALFGVFLDIRLKDARCVFYHSRTWAIKSQSESLLITMMRKISSVLFAVIMLLFVMMFELGLVNSPNINATLGSSAHPVQVFQLIQSFLTGYAIQIGLDSFEDVVKSRRSKINLQSFNAPIVPEYVDFARPLQPSEPDPVSSPPSDVNPDSRISVQLLPGALQESSQFSRASLAISRMGARQTLQRSASGAARARRAMQPARMESPGSQVASGAMQEVPL